MIFFFGVTFLSHVENNALFVRLMHLYHTLHILHVPLKKYINQQNMSLNTIFELHTQFFFGLLMRQLGQLSF